MMVQDIIAIIRNNSDLIKPYYSDVYFDVNADHEAIDIFIYTKVQKATEKQVKKVVRLFNGKDGCHIGIEDLSKDDKPFWSIKLVDYE